MTYTTVALKIDQSQATALEVMEQLLLQLPISQSTAASELAVAKYQNPNHMLTADCDDVSMQPAVHTQHWLLIRVQQAPCISHPALIAVECATG